MCAASPEPARARRLAALYDLHGNVFALDAVLAEARSEGVDLVVFGGDLAWGAFPHETVERAFDPGLPAAYVRGNGDREMAAPVADGDDWVSEITRWCAARLDERQRAALGAQPAHATVRVDGLGDVLFCHGSPRSDEESLTFLTPEERLGEATAGVDAPVVVCGHTHMQFDRTCGGIRVVNAGSVGMPYEGRPGAYWCLLDASGITLRRTEYDFEAAAAAIAGSGVPYATEMARDVLSPPGRDETAAQFEGGG
ncbi:MAG TPA: metallophosphoesterase family protein [Actinomycetota bacterium]|nr:metallophosphoesterase family protein [Actinomycetota bacterium]